MSWFRNSRYLIRAERAFLTRVVCRELKDGDVLGHDLRERNTIVMQEVDTMRLTLVLAIGLFGLTQSAFKCYG